VNLPQYTTVTPEELLRHEPYVRRLAAGLVSDPNRAADIAQETWVKALRRPPRNATSLRGWFRKVVRSVAATVLEAETVRTGREAQVEERAAGSSALEEATMHQLRDVLTTELAALDEPYREVLTLRFIEDRQPAEVAQELGVPVSTVHTRVRRGLERLRKRLDRRFDGDRSAWSPGMLALAISGRSTPPAPAALALPLSMLVGLVVVLGLGLRVGGSSGAPEAVSPGAPTSRASLTRELNDARRVASAPITEPRKLDASTGGDLLAIVRWEDDGSPAAGQSLLLEGRGRSRTVTTDSRGRVLIEELRPGTWRVAAATGSAPWVEVAPDAEALIELTVPRGRSLSGVVRAPESFSVTGAIVFASFPDRPERLAVQTSVAEDGSFHLTGIDSRATVGVVHGDRGQLFTLDQPACEGLERVTLFLPPHAGSLAAQVVDDAGEPIVGARVDAEDTGLLRPMIRRDGIHRLDRNIRSAVTDEEGLFSLGNYGVRPPVLRVTAAGFGPRRLSASPGERIVLTDAAGLEGVLTWPDGSPAAFAEVSAADGTGQWLYTRCDPRGRFEFSGLPAGAVRLKAHANDGERFGIARFSPRLRAGERTAWEGVLCEGGGLHGRLVDRGGDPLPGWRIQLTPEGGVVKSGNPWLPFEGPARDSTVLTASDGSFRISGLTDQVYQLRAFDPLRPGLVALTRDLHPSEAELRLTVDFLSETLVTGVLRSKDGAVPQGARLVLSGARLERPQLVPVDGVTGAFEAGGLPAGTYRAKAWWPGHQPVELESVRVEGGPVADLGELLVPADGRLRITVEGPAKEGAHILVCRGNLPIFECGPHRRGGNRTLEVDGSVLTPPLSPGVYHVAAWRSTGVPMAQTVTVTSGAETEVRMGGGASERDLVVYLAQPPDHPGKLVVEIVAEGGYGLPQVRLPVAPSDGGPILISQRLPNTAFEVVATLLAPGQATATQSGRTRCGPAIAGEGSERIEVRLETCAVGDR
jgi:RNA polymerase sigma factor (sigma-70 family)